MAKKECTLDNFVQEYLYVEEYIYDIPPKIDLEKIEEKIERGVIVIDLLT